MRRTMPLVFATSIIAALLALLVAPTALAHEPRAIGHTAWHVEVGWATEPTYAGFPNAVQLFLHDKNDRPVVDLADTLEVDVTSGGKTTTLSFSPAFEIGGDGAPGDYRASFVPTRPGTYAFRLHGTIKGDRINSTFTCSEKTFDCVRDPQEIQFPAQDPSNQQLNDLIAREAARVAKTAHDDSSSAKTLAYVGIGVGALGVILALVLGLRRRSAPAPRA